ncbi:MAG TPA: hypothetical protein VK988_05525 [Acidimicrobiales bacterium]|nr:hypothetical protein [Acidimicrobiales bacterium]
MPIPAFVAETLNDLIEAGVSSAGTSSAHHRADRFGWPSGVAGSASPP